MVQYTEPSRYNWMLQYYLRAEGLALSWVGTGRLIFSLNYTDADFTEVADRFVAAADEDEARRLVVARCRADQQEHQAADPERDACKEVRALKALYRLSSWPVGLIVIACDKREASRMVSEATTHPPCLLLDGLLRYARNDDLATDA